MGYLLCQAALGITEVGPRGTCDAAELHEVEGQGVIGPGMAPARYEGGKLGFEKFYVVGVRLALVPDDSAQGEARERRYAALVEVAWLIGMALQRVCAQLYVLTGTAAYPRLYAVVVAPVGEDVHECGVVLEGVARGV